MDWGTLIVAMLGSGLLSAAVTSFADRRRTKSETQKNEADAVQVISATAMQLINPLKKRVEDLEKEAKTADKQIKRLEKLVGRYARRIEHLMTGITILLKQLADMNAQPCWKPDEWPAGENDKEE